MNCWIGVSVTDAEMLYDALDNLRKVQAKVKFISFEPLLERVNGGECDDTYRLGGLEDASISWVIVGQQTPVKMSTMPQIGWVEEIINAADKANIPVFLKDNLISCVDQYDFALKDGKYRQEFPK
jgi:protein gp37